MEELKSKAESHFQKFKSWLTVKKALLIGAAIVPLVFILLIIIIKSLPPVKMDSPYAFSVIKSYPEYSTNSAKPDIILHFNEAVDAEHAEHFITIDPPVPGQWLPGGTSNILVLTPTQNLPRNSEIEVTVKKGFMSQEGSKLFSDYKFKFYVYYEQDRITLQKGEIEGKVFSFPQSIGAKFSVRLIGDYTKPNIKVYKASVSDLLNDLTYSLNQEKVYSAGYKQGEFKNPVIDISKLTLVKEYQEVTSDGQIEFTGPTGLYLFQSFNDDAPVNTTWVTLNDSGIHFRQDDQDFYLAPQDLTTGSPQTGFTANLYTLNDSVQKLDSLSLDGIAKYHLEYPKRIDLVTVEKGSDVIIIPVGLPDSLAQISVDRNMRTEDKVFLYTDRPIYRKGDKVQFRGLVRADNDANYSASPSKTVHVYLNAYDEAASVSRKIVDLNLPIGPGGKFSGEFQLPQDFAGNRTLTATTKPDDQRSSYSSTYASFDIYEYVKPEFGLDVSLDRDEYIKGDEVTANIKGYYFDGRPLANQKVVVAAYKQDFFETEKKVYSESFNITGWGGMCGGGGFDDYIGAQIGTFEETSLDKNGMGQYKLKTNALDTQISQKITIVADKNFRHDESLSVRVLDPGENYDYEAEQIKKKERISSAKTAVVHNGDFNVFLMPFSTTIKSGENLEAYFYSESLIGEKLANKEFKYSITQEIYDSTASKYNSKVFKQGTAITNAEGIGRIIDTVPAVGQVAGSYYLNVESTDGRGNNIKASKYIYISQPQREEYVYSPYTYNDSSSLLKIVSEESNLTPGNFASVNINSPADLNVFVTFDRGRVYAPQWLSLKKGDNQFRFHVADAFMPSISPTFSYFINGEFRVEGMTFNVPAMKKLITVEVVSDKPSYKPGETATLTVVTKNHEGIPVSAEIGASVVDKAIYALKKRSESPLHSSFYYARSRSTNISSSLTWVGIFGGGRGGGGGDGGFSPDLFKDVDTLYWNPNLKTGSDGKLTIQVPLGQSKTTWRALFYASTDDTNLGQNDFDFLVTD